MHESDSERNLSPLAHTLAHMAQAARQAEISPDGEELASDDALELMDAPIEALPAEALVEARPRPRAATPPPVPTGAPPPIPGAFPRPASTKKEDGALRIPLPILPEALAQRPRRPKRSKPWFEEVFDEDYLRTLPFMTAEQTLREVSFIEESLEARTGAEILDVACGYGRHAIELVQRGLKIPSRDS